MTFYMYIFLLQTARDGLFLAFYAFINLFKAYFFIFILGHGNDTLKVMGFTAQHISTVRL